MRCPGGSAAQLGVVENMELRNLSDEAVTVTASRIHSSGLVQIVDSPYRAEVGNSIGGVGRKGEMELLADEARTCWLFAHRMR